jgi:hypothetical protein
MLDKHDAVNKALKIFREHYPSNFRGTYFEDNYRVTFDRLAVSFTVSWKESKWLYDVTLFLNGSIPLVIATESVTTTKSVIILK